MKWLESVAAEISQAPEQSPARLWISHRDGEELIGCSGLSPDTLQLIKGSRSIALTMIKEAEAMAIYLMRNYPERQDREEIIKTSYGEDSLLVAAVLAAFDINRELIALFAERFVNPSEGFYFQITDGRYVAEDRKLIVQDIQKHCTGKITIGFPSVASDGTCKWVCFDDDSYLPTEQNGRLELIEAHLRNQGITTLREGKRIVGNGKSKQGHLWVLFKEPIQAELARAWALRVVRDLALSMTNLEIFPKQNKPGKLGNCVRGPLGKHAKDGGKRGRFRDAPWPIQDQLEWLIAQPLNPADQIIEIGKKELELQEARSKYRYNFTKPASRNEGPTVPEMLKELNQKPCSEQHDRYLYQCPICEAEGKDNSKNNLHVGKQTPWFGCWQGGFNKEHTSKLIYKKLLQLTGRSQLHT